MAATATRSLEIGLYTVGVMAALLTLGLLRLPDTTLAWTTLADFGHAPLFGGVAIAIWQIVRAAEVGESRRPLRGMGLALAITLLLGAATELAQLGSSRDSSLADFLRDAVGAVSFLWLAATGSRWGVGARLFTRCRWAHRLAALALLSSAAVPGFMVAGAYAGRERAFPQLVEFGATWTSYFTATGSAVVEVTPSPETGTGNTRSAARITFLPADYPSFQVEEPYPDWAGYQHLRVAVFSPLRERVELVLRVHDRWHTGAYEDRFHRVLTIEPGENRFSIPLADLRHAPASREMDLSAIRGIALFAVAPPRAFSLFLTELRLDAIRADAAGT